MRVLIVDDVVENRMGLRSLLAGCFREGVVDEAGSLGEARRRMAEAFYELVFLDVELEQECGFDLMAGAPEGTCFVLVSAHQHLGDRAFDAGAADYMVKPVTEERLMRSLRRAAVRLGRVVDQEVRVGANGGGACNVSLESVVAVMGDGAGSRVLCAEGGLVDHRTLREWEKLLEGRGFVRLDRLTLLRPGRIAGWSFEDGMARISFELGKKSVVLSDAAWTRLSPLLADSGAVPMGEGGLDWSV